MLRLLLRPSKPLFVLPRLSHSDSHPRFVLRDDEQPLGGAEGAHHPWPEWTALMGRLAKMGYLDPGGGPKESNHIRTACLNFARDHSQLIRRFSRRDISTVVGSGCPTLDRKVVNSGKRLRSHVGIDEAEVCGSCNLRSRCDRANMKAQEDEGGRTVDVVRILLTYGLDVVTGAVENQTCMTKSVKESIRKLLNELLVFSVKELDCNTPALDSERPRGHQMPQGRSTIPMKQGDWICPKCYFLNFAKNINCLSCNGFFEDRLRKLHEGSEHLPLKKGDWICEKCNFFNFAKNSKCLQCLENPPKRDLSPGEWECASCNYINFRRNMVCFKCDWKRPKASASGEIAANTQSGRQGHENLPGRRSTWNGGNTVGNHFSHQHCSSEKEDDGLLSSNDDPDDEDDVENWDKFDEFDNFPIVGGKGVTSQDPLVRESWKEAMLKKSKGVSEGPSEYKGDSSFARFCKEMDDASDDDDIAGWFKS